ncbi:hypothetical protein D9757_005175 [Collybiopsis confluens]|uniref:Polyprotein n=1 Tax=Collybiopsis confluens TaxID=2823264 RepID=A0A8H5HW09_9AGAR|nr:hypothetical protein D9757_005175 [Collybiopsis confluens]
MTSVTSSLPTIQHFPDNCQLQGVSNFLAFTDHVISLAYGNGLFGYLDGSIARPAGNNLPQLLAAGAAGGAVHPVATLVNSTTPSLAEWCLRNARLAYIIYINVKDPRAIGLKPDDSANTLWVKLQAKFNTQTAAIQIIARKRIDAHIFAKTDRFNDYFNGLNCLKSEAIAVGCSIDDDALVAKFLSRLDESQMWIIQQWASKTYDEIAAGLTEYQLHKDIISGTSLSLPPSNVVSSALAVSVPTGHHPRSTLVCYNCSRRGHSISRCWAPGGGAEGKAPQGYRPPKTTTTTAAAVTASTLLSTSTTTAPSTLSTIYDLGSDLKGTTTTSPAVQFVIDCLNLRHRGEASSLLDCHWDATDGGSSVHGEAHVFVTAKLNGNSSPTYLDSGASECCVWDRGRFSTFIARKAFRRMAAEGSGGQFEIEGYGIAHFAVRTRSGKLISDGGSLHPFFRDEFTLNPDFRRKGICWRLGWGSNGGERPQDWRFRPELQSKLVLGHSTNHNRFAHINTNTVSLMKRKNLVDGLEITDGNLCGCCEACLLGKAIHRPFDAIVMPSTEVLERVSLDLWGRARTRSLGGAYYLLVAVDDATGIPDPYFSATKDALLILELVKNFVVKAEKQTEKKLTRFCIDLGREFDNKLFDDYAASIGVIVEKIPKDSSAANGMVERANWTVISNVRTMIEDSDLGYEFWAEATSSFCYVKSMVPTSRVPGVIPIQKWFPNHARINVSHLR